MQFKELAHALIAGFAASSVLLPLHQPTSAQSTLLQCVNTANGYTTVIPGSNGSVTPLISFSSISSPQQACQTVTSRLNSAVAASSGNWSTVLLRTGSIRSRNVICVVRSESTGCSTSNELLTVPSGQDPGLFLEQLLQINAEVYSLGNPDQHTRRRTYMRFGQALRQQVSTVQRSPSPSPSRSPSL